MRYLVADVETYGTDPRNGKLLGIALCYLDEMIPFYIGLQWYNYKTSSWQVNLQYDHIMKTLSSDLLNAQLIGHNYAYDKLWIDYNFKIDSKWHSCTRLMWHCASSPSGPRPYGLKDAQVELLGHQAKGNTAINEQIRARGGKPGQDIYLADKELIVQYAMIDAKSTAELYNYLKPFYDKHDYWWMLEKMVKYSWLLQECTNAGIKVNETQLEAQIALLSTKRAQGASKFLEQLSTPIKRLEMAWRDDRAAKYTIPSAKQRFLNTYDMQKKFKLSSDKDKRELFYDILQLPIIVETEGGKGATGVDAIKLAAKDREDLKEIVEIYEEYETSETLFNNFAKPWSGALYMGRLHPRFNPCGTVSYRLSGFKPYLLNAPFDQKELMSCLTCDDGWEGVHADFTSIEPAVTAHYSQDQGLLKVFKEGKGDVYLDLATTLFPNDQALKEGYNPNNKITSEIKERFKEQRKVAKVIQLAVQYTGTKYTVAKNLTNSGFPTSLDEADRLVQAYWKHFYKVELMNESLFQLYEKQGYLRNVVGRIIQVPSHVKIVKKDGTMWEKPIERYKDLPNRFIQSSAHDVLSFWVLKIAELIKERGITAKAVILDCHDSTSWQAPKKQIALLEQCFVDALKWLNEEVGMTVPVKIEMKRFTTLAGLKGKE